jgi:hypothetical protein
MTVLEASSKLIEFFTSHDYFDFKRDFKQICLISDTSADEVAVLAALEELVKQNFLVNKKIENQEFWVLVKPIPMHEQNVSISVALGLEISNILNNTILIDEERKCNPINLNEQDIFHLVMLIKNNLANFNDKNEEKKEDN